jgi:2-polyprenyl-6-methoxyphenol hydroxylase-like FAD-dependent oxidoreductase
MAVQFDTDVLVVGAGPVGLITALTLATNGVKIRVIEKLPALATGQRGAGIAVNLHHLHVDAGLTDVNIASHSGDLSSSWHR